jgi:hypothetical protein
MGLMMEAQNIPETSANIYHITRLKTQKTVIFKTD